MSTSAHDPSPWAIKYMSLKEKKTCIDSQHRHKHAKCLHPDANTLIAVINVLDKKYIPQRRTQTVTEASKNVVLKVYAKKMVVYISSLVTRMQDTIIT